ncbi:tetratricopeptide repeat protein [Belliella kenyensis]|uniref:Tetratricopeptide repeat protein n=1 Tax=Belliella kenyensis TaxID=1472724 RepID=A0ABV8EPP9_9BACT|nr:tetratricopeptide repeat protein [Belliella kenyensis]MCH7402064.1 tetratricopeptide repeat protein [Belliella kenyensis]MDN3605228.1 tetratricopeptide repeat protein [Belliella kenyensis]
MSNLSRISLLKTFIDQEPNNPFNWYALALEHREHQPEEAAKHFDHLLQNHPEYLPTYYHAAQLFADLAQVEKSKLIYQKGINVAKSQNDNHALRELQNSYQNFLIDNDLF